MKKLLILLSLLAAAQISVAEEIVIQRIQGEVAIRHGVTEDWKPATLGAALKANVTIKTGKNGSAILAVPKGHIGHGVRRITLPAEVIIDVSDIRELTQEELILKLTMEKVRSSSYEWKNNDLRIPSTTVVHGADRSRESRLSENDVEIGKLQLNGTKVLYENGFYSTCALKSLEVFRLYPPLSEHFESRMLVAESLEKAELNGEALQEYVAISRLESLSREQLEKVRMNISQLRKQSEH